MKTKEDEFRPKSIRVSTVLRRNPNALENLDTLWKISSNKYEQCGLMVCPRCRCVLIATDEYIDSYQESRFCVCCHVFSPGKEFRVLAESIETIRGMMRMLK